jgi:D-alanine-D-alanine ligase
MAQKRVLVAFGGVSPEHEVSVLTAMQAIAALGEAAYECIPLYISKSGKWFTGPAFLQLESYKNLDKLINKATQCTFEINESGRTVLSETTGGGLFSRPKSHEFDVVLAAFHGSDGENGSFQGVCEVFNVPYTGSGVLGSAIGMDKFAAKQLCRAHGFPVVPDVAFYESEWVANQNSILEEAEKIGYPLFVKPVNLGSSIGVSKAADKATLIEKIETAFRYDAHIIVEKGVQPLMEINCSVIGTPEKSEASVLEHPVAASEVLTFEDKYQSGDAVKGMASASRIIPAPLDDDTTHKIQHLATSIFQKLNCSGLARLDFLVKSDTNELFFNEINSIPGSFSFYLWDKSDISFPDLLIRLIHIAEDRHRQKNGRVRTYETNLLSQKAATGLKGLKGTKK